MKYSTACDIIKYWEKNGRLYRSANDQRRCEASNNGLTKKKTGQRRKLIVTIEVPDRPTQINPNSASPHIK